MKNLIKMQDGNYSYKKIIYPKARRLNVNAEKVKEILQLEINYVKSMRKDLEFLKLEKPIENKDLSSTYNLIFTPKR